MLRSNTKGALQSGGECRLVQIVVVARQDCHEGLVILPGDASETMQYRRRGAFVRRLYDSLRRKDSGLAKVEGSMAPR
jgi:hypothetical protein